MSEQDQQRAWEQLGTVEQHPQIQQWLDESDARHTAHREMPARRRLFWATAASLVMAVGGAGTLAYLHFGPRHFETGVGEQRDVLLADGSRIALNTDTALTVHYSAGSRRIELQRGEALFTVKHDATRPFDVAAGKTLTRAIGTEFNVDMRRSHVTVSVLEGVVRVSGPLVPVAALARGQALEFSPKEQRLRAEKADIKRIDAWRTRRLEFSDTPLAEAVEEFNRYSTTRVVIGTAGLESVRVSGVFRIGDTDGFLYSLREALGLQTHATTDEVVLMRAPNDPTP